MKTMTTAWVKFACLSALCALASAAANTDASARRQELDTKSAESPLMKFTTADHNKFLTGGGRDYGVFVLFTATDPAFNCQNCKPTLTEMGLIAESFLNAKPADQHVYFAYFDFDASVQKVFQKYEIASAPLVWYFPAKGKPTDADKYNDIMRKGLKPEALIKFVRDKTGVDFRVKRPTNWTNLIIMVGVFGGLATLAWLFTPVAFIMRFAKPILALFSMGCTLLFPCGYMWNQIRGAGWYTRGQNGETEVWAKGNGNQTVSETMSLCMLHGVFALAVILMIMAPKINVPKVPSDVFSIVGLVAATVFLSMDWYLYRVHKNGGYPYSLVF